MERQGIPFGRHLYRIVSAQEWPASRDSSETVVVDRRSVSSGQCEQTTIAPNSAGKP